MLFNVCLCIVVLIWLVELVSVIVLLGVLFIEVFSVWCVAVCVYFCLVCGVVVFD